MGQEPDGPPALLKIRKDTTQPRTETQDSRAQHSGEDKEDGYHRPKQKDGEYRAPWSDGPIGEGHYKASHTTHARPRNSPYPLRRKEAYEVIRTKHGPQALPDIACLEQQNRIQSPTGKQQRPPRTTDNRKEGHRKEGRTQAPVYSHSPHTTDAQPQSFLLLTMPLHFILDRPAPKMQPSIAVGHRTTTDHRP